MVGLDSPLKPPPPLTSFLGCRSRIMASLRSFLSRRQTDRTTLTFGSCVFLLKQAPPNLSRGNVLATSLGESKLKNCARARAVLTNAQRVGSEFQIRAIRAISD